MIWYSSPYKEGNIGGGYNEFCERVPSSEDWICLTDADAMFLTNGYGSFIEKIVERNSDYGLIGAVTNRVRDERQCYDGSFSDEMNIRKHREIATDLMYEHGTLVEPFHLVAGFFMLFQKKTWQEVGGFTENSITADKDFNGDVKRSGGKVGIARGLYMFHAYRIWESERLKAANSIDHLKTKKQNNHV